MITWLLLLSLFFESFSHQPLPMVFHGSLSDSKFSQVSRTLLSILADLNNVLVWMFPTCPFISKSSSPSTNPLVTVPSVPITIGITVTFMFHSFFSSLVRSMYLSFFSPFFSFTQRSAGTAESINQQVLFFFLLTITRSGRLVKIRWSVYISKSQRILCISFSWMDSGLCIYHLSVWSNSNFLHNSQWITLPTQSYLVLYSLCANLLHLLITWLIVIIIIIGYLKPYNCVQTNNYYWKEIIT